MLTQDVIQATTLPLQWIARLIEAFPRCVDGRRDAITLHLNFSPISTRGTSVRSIANANRQPLDGKKVASLTAEAERNRSPDDQRLSHN